VVVSTGICFGCLILNDYFKKFIDTAINVELFGPVAVCQTRLFHLCVVFAIIVVYRFFF